MPTNGSDISIERHKARHYVLIKRDGVDRLGRKLSALESARTLLDAKIWPLWEHTKNRKAIGAGDRVAVYLAGLKEPEVIATADIERCTAWTREADRCYPLALDGIPVATLVLTNVRYLPVPILVRHRLAALSFVKPGSPKWGVAFMGGSRALSAADFSALTCPPGTDIVAAQRIDRSERRLSRGAAPADIFQTEVFK